MNQINIIPALKKSQFTPVRIVYMNFHRNARRSVYFIYSITEKNFALPRFEPTAFDSLLFFMLKLIAFKNSPARLTR
jgi:hypothetical protein